MENIKTKEQKENDNIVTELSGIDVPLTTRSKIIIKLDKISYTFAKDTYKEDYLKNYISEEDFLEILSQSNLIISRSWKKKKIQDLHINSPSIEKLKKISLFLSIIYLLSLCLSKNISQVSNLLELISIGAVVSLFICLFILMLIVYFTQNVAFYKIEDFAKDDMKTYLAQVNEKYKNSLEWKYFKKASYIECTILNYNDNNIAEKSIYSERQKLIDDSESLKE